MGFQAEFQSHYDPNGELCSINCTQDLTSSQLVSSTNQLLAVYSTAETSSPRHSQFRAWGRQGGCDSLIANTGRRSQWTGHHGHTFASKHTEAGRWAHCKKGAMRGPELTPATVPPTGHS